MEKAKYIDHTILKAVATKEDVYKICMEAIKYNFKSVCINPCFVKYAKDLLKDSEVLVCTVIGFPLGANTSETKAYETREAIENGADEVDMVINVGALKEKDYSYVLDDIVSVRLASKEKTLKVILETCYLDSQEIEMASKLSLEAGADFVKTSTGFGTGGATVEDVALMKKTVGDNAEVKASGGIRNKEDFDSMINAGATRIGASSGVEIMKGETSNSNY